MDEKIWFKYIMKQQFQHSAQLEALSRKLNKLFVALGADQSEIDLFDETARKLTEDLVKENSDQIDKRFFDSDS